LGAVASGGEAGGVAGATIAQLSEADWPAVARIYTAGIEGRNAAFVASARTSGSGRCPTADGATC
jgi:hypothetical protein